MKKRKQRSQDFEVVIGLTGLKAAGKDELSERLAAHGFVTRRCSDEIRDEAKRRGIDKPTIDQLIEIGNWGREQGGGMAYWAKRVVATLKSQGHRRIIVNGMRHPDEVTGLQKLLGDRFVMVGIVAPTHVRAARLLGRKRPGDPVDMSGFTKLDDDDRGIGQPPHGQQVDRTLALVPWENLYNNRGTLEEYQVWIDAFASRLLKKGS